MSDLLKADSLWRALKGYAERGKNRFFTSHCFFFGVILVGDTINLFNENKTPIVH